MRRILYVLALFEAGATLVALLGGALFMGGAWWYVLPGLALAALYIVAGQAGADGRRWGLVTLFTAEMVRVTAFGLGLLIGLLPWVNFALTGAALADALVLPALLAAIAIRVLIRPPAPPLAPTLALPTEWVLVGTEPTA
ncbi:MAG TPA: hypothetical protein VGJ28_18540 [Micromonosporaceae bacterium]|jgi:hypothetical protein